MTSYDTWKTHDHNEDFFSSLEVIENDPEFISLLHSDEEWCILIEMGEKEKANARREHLIMEVYRGNIELHIP